MNKSSTLQNSLMLTPLIGVTDSLVTALGLWLMFALGTQCLRCEHGASCARD